MPSRVIIVTGVSSGLGQAFVLHALGVEGPDTAVVGLGRRDLPEPPADTRYAFHRLDLEDAQMIGPTIRGILSRYPSVDVFVNNAGSGQRGTVEDLATDDIRRQFEANFFGPLEVTRAVVARMRNQGYGHIINVGTVGALVDTPTLGYYGSAKAAFAKITRVLALEAEPFGIEISTFIPGAMRTGFGRNMRSNGQPRSGAYAAAYAEWDRRFANFFRRRLGPEDAARRLYSLVSRPRLESYPDLRDRLMCLVLRLAPPGLRPWITRHIFYPDHEIK
jgi:NAD(P)-dependent dehydrogenase (short-subunit alcohol dehydrogenase family)